MKDIDRCATATTRLDGEPVRPMRDGDWRLVEERAYETARMWIWEKDSEIDE